MGLKRTSQPSVEPVTLSDALVHLREDTGVSDAYVTTLITVARQTCEDLLQRTLITSTWTLMLDNFPDAIELTRSPILSVTSLKFIDTAGVQQTLNPSDYIVDTANSEVGYIVPAFNKSWPDTRPQINAVEVVYTAGYGASAASVPAPIKQWILLAIGDMYERRNRSGESFSTKGGSGKAVPQDFAEGLLDAYKVWTI